MKFVYVDFEFTGINESRLDLVSVALKAYDTGVMTYDRTLWLYRDKAKQAKARDFLKMLMDKGYIFVAYVMEAEARSMLTLFDGKMPDFKAIDLYLEYRCLLNHNDDYCYGEQYIDGKVIKTTRPPNKWAQPVATAKVANVSGGYVEYRFESEEDDEDESHHKPSYSLAAATFKLLGEKIDTVEKDEVRDIIIKGTPQDIEANVERVLKYNASDIVYLPKILDKIFNVHKKQGEALEGWLVAAQLRGDYAVRTARMIALGYPVNMDKVKALTHNVEGILNEAIEECLECSSEVEAFRYDKKDQKYKANQNNIKRWVREQEKPYWRKTKGKDLSLSKDAFKDWYSSESPGFAGAYCRFLKTKQSLNGFLPSKTSKKGAFTDFIGSDNRVRPYFGIYGSQSSRSQPGATAYLWLKSKWMQNFLEAKPGKALAACDFASQEFLVAGIISQDDNMIDSYASGDVYLAFGKIAGMIPEGGTKESHRKEREICKTIILGMSYGMTSIGLAPRLSAAMNQTYTPDEVQRYVDLFEQAYPEYQAWKWETLRSYQDNDFLQLSDGWTMWGDNDNARSVTNFMVQGEGAVVLRESVRLCQEAGLDVIATVHDSIVIESTSNDATPSVRTLQRCMQQGFENVMSKFGRTVPIRIEGECWSQDFPVEPWQVDNIKYMREFIHEKAVADYERYKKYLVPPTPEQIEVYKEKMAREIEANNAKVSEVKVKLPRKSRLPKTPKVDSTVESNIS